MSRSSCEHFDALEEFAEPSSDVCDQCVAMGDSWVHLRSCLGCGAVGCCDNSVNQHARKHWEKYQHPLMKSIERGDGWKYCFPDDFLKR